MENNIINVEARTADIIAIEIKTTVRHTQKIMLESAISIGNDLIEVKELVPHGEWEKWLEEKVDFSQSKATKYMKVAREYGQISKTDLNATLSYTNALELLALPEEDRADFIENNDVENMKVKELKEEIKKLKDEKGDIARQLNDAEVEKQLIQQGNAILEDEAKELKEKIEELENQSSEEDNSEEESQKINEALEESKKLLEEKETELEKEQTKAEKLQEKIEKLEADKAAEIERAKEEASAKAKAEAEKESEEELNKAREEVKSATDKLAQAEKKIELSSNEDMVVFKILVDKLQESFNEIVNTVENIGLDDKEQSAKCKNALGMILDSLKGKL